VSVQHMVREYDESYSQRNVEKELVLLVQIKIDIYFHLDGCFAVDKEEEAGDYAADVLEETVIEAVAVVELF